MIPGVRGFGGGYEIEDGNIVVVEDERDVDLDVGDEQNSIRVVLVMNGSENETGQTPCPFSKPHPPENTW
jgi:hypothetical protein